MIIVRSSFAVEILSVVEALDNIYMSLKLIDEVFVATAAIELLTDTKFFLMPSILRV